MTTSTYNLVLLAPRFPKLALAGLLSESADTRGCVRVSNALPGCYAQALNQQTRYASCLASLNGITPYAGQSAGKRYRTEIQIPPPRQAPRMKGELYSESRQLAKSLTSVTLSVKIGAIVDKKWIPLDGRRPSPFARAIKNHSAEEMDLS